jgi:hypothetical protein
MISHSRRFMLDSPLMQMMIFLLFYFGLFPREVILGNHS